MDISQESEIIKKLQAGDEQAYSYIFKSYYKGLCAFASQYVDPLECEEIVQEAMMWLWENKQALLTEIPLKGLLFTIVRNKCLNVISHLRIRYKVHDMISGKFEETFEDPEFYMYNELIDLYEKAVAGLPDDYREAFEMNRFGNLTYNEIAEQKGLSPKTIAYRISQALKILRIQLADYLPFLF